MRRWLNVLIAAPALAGVSHAAPVAGAYEAYARGDYAEAVELAVASGSAEDYALAARALNAVSYFENAKKPARRTAKDAYDFAEKAIALDPALPEAHLQAAISLALKGARISPVRALLSGVAREARDAIDEALALAPENAWALSTSAAWRIEVARRGGGSLYDADPAEGHREFMAARRKEPGNPAIAYECALRLLADGRREWRADALSSLDAAIAATPATEFERDVQARARELKRAIEKGPDAERAFIEAQP